MIYTLLLFDLDGTLTDPNDGVNKSCSGAPQQQANGSYRSVELLAVIATLLFNLLSILMNSSSI